MDSMDIRLATMDDIPDIILLEKQVWAEGLRATEAMLKSRIETFPEGQIVAILDGILRGFLSTQILEYDIENPITSWYKATDNGFIKNTHTAKGNLLYGVNLSARPVKEVNVADELVLAAGKLIVSFNLQGAILGARIPSYHKYASKMSIKGYVGTTTKTGRLLDPELNLYRKFGMNIVKIIPEYIEDIQSSNYGVLMYWKNPLHRKDAPSSAFSRIDQIYDYASGSVTSRWTLLLPAAGCQWAKKSGCYMCGFSNRINEVYAGREPTAFEVSGVYRIGRQLIEQHQPDMLSIYNAGSFLNEKEVPLSAQLGIFEDVARHRTIRRVMVETRPEFVTHEKLSTLTSVLRGKKLQLAIGLETVSDFVRTHCINKGFTKETFEAAVKTAKAMGSELLTYVFLKPLFLSEKEAIAEAIETIRYAFSLGSDAVAIEAAFIQEGTVMWNHFIEGRFKPPWLWSIIDVVRNCSNLGPVYIGGFEDEPPPIAVPANCGLCDSTILGAFKNYNKTLDIGFLDNLNCKCRREWEKELLKEYAPLEERISR
jgi:radical SAM enzyme (TIGR01210 family)